MARPKTTAGQHPPQLLAGDPVRPSEAGHEEDQAGDESADVDQASADLEQPEQRFEAA